VGITDSGPATGLSRQPLATTLSGAAYVSQCRAEGVPVPDQVTNSTGWINHGVLATEFLEQSLTAEVWSWRPSSGPDGLCLALPRWNGSNTAQLFGLICMGVVTSRTCFFDNPNGTFFPRNVATPITSFVGGAALVPNLQGVCTDCHAGENPWIIHPEAAPFANLLTTRAEVLRPDRWPDPIVEGSWPMNDGPLLELGPVGAGQQRCDGCHTQANAGRFPLPSTNRTFGFCNTVLFGALNGTGGSGATMPPTFGAPGSYAAHAAALQSFCNATLVTGVIQQGMAPPDMPSVLSPPMIVEPFYTCGGVIGVQGARAGALVTLHRNGDPMPVASATSTGTLVEFPLSALGAMGMAGTWTARQHVGVNSSPPSLAATARAITADYPSGLPAPQIDPVVLYASAQAVGVLHVPGATLEIQRTRAPSGPVSVTRATGSYPFTVALADATFLSQDVIRVRQRCGSGTYGPLSTAMTVRPAPASLNPGPVVDQNRIFAGQSLIPVVGLTEGARLELGPYTSGSWAIHALTANVAVPLGRPVATTDTLAMRQRLGAATSTTVNVIPRPCSQLPPARASAPAAGTDLLRMLDIVPGSIIRVRAGATEIGDGSGPVIRLTRNVVSGETLVITQELPTCSAGQFFQIQVP
jgi:hypothetical protein